MKKNVNQGKSNFAQQKLVKTKRRRVALASDRRVADIVEQGSRNDRLPRLEIVMIAISDLRPSPHHTRLRRVGTN